MTESTYNVDAKIANAEGNEVNNPAYDQNKSGKKEIEILLSLKHLSNFWRTLDMHLINCKVSLTFIWSRECVITSMERRIRTNIRRHISLTGGTHQISNIKLRVPVVTLSTEDDNKSLEQLKSGLKRTIEWNKYRSEMTYETKTNNLNCLIDSQVNRLFVWPFENEEDRTFFSTYYTPKFEMEEFNVLIDGKVFSMCQ